MILPMNANAVTDHKEQELLLDDPNYIAERKYDGYRGICDDGFFYSRLGNDFSEKVPHLVKILAEFSVVLDGELLVTDDKNSGDVTRILGSLPEKALHRQATEGYLHYRIFDILRNNDIQYVGNVLFKERRKYLEEFFYENLTEEDRKYIELSEVYTDKRALLKQSTAHNWEGIMLKNLSSYYYPDMRPAHNWYKIKRHFTADVVIMGYTEGKGKYKGLIGAIVFGLYNNAGELIERGQCSGFSDLVRYDVSCNKDKYINRVMEIEGTGTDMTKDGHFRHPVFKLFKLDKEAKQCLTKNELC